MKNKGIKYLFCACIFSISLLGLPGEANSTTVAGVVVSEGIVLAGDSRTTVTITEKIPIETEEKDKTIKRIKMTSRIATDYTQKVFRLNERVGAVTYGEARLLNKNIHSLVEEFKASDPSINKQLIDELAKRLKRYFDDIYKTHLSKYPDIKIGTLGLMVAGYDSSGRGKLLDFKIPARLGAKPRDGEIKQLYSTEIDFGAAWRGQIDVITRLMKGCSPELAKRLREHPELKINPYQSKYVVGFEYMTIRDAVEFAAFLIRTTIETQRFSYGTKKHIGTVPGVGGPIDIAIITPTGFKWVQKKGFKDIL